MDRIALDWRSRQIRIALNPTATSSSWQLLGSSFLHPENAVSLRKAIERETIFEHSGVHLEAYL